MGHVKTPGYPHANLLDLLNVVGKVVARLPYGVSEPVLCGTAAISLYTAGMWPSAEVELWASEPLVLAAALTAEGFLPDDSTASGQGWLRRSDLRCALRIAADRQGLGSAMVTNAVQIGLYLDANAIFERGLFSMRVIGIEDLIADQIVEWWGQGGRQGEAAVLIQVFVELGRMGVGGPFRAAYLQRRLDRETNGEAVFELPHSAPLLDDLSLRHTSLAAIARVVGAWRSRRGLYSDEDETAADDASRTAPGCIDRHRNDLEEWGGRSKAPTAQILPFPSQTKARPPKDTGS
jgi:hypothetical protein